MSVPTFSSLVQTPLQERLDRFYNVLSSPQDLANSLLEGNASKRRKREWSSLSTLGVPTTLNMNGSRSSSPHPETIPITTAPVQSALPNSAVEESATASASSTNEATTAATATSTSPPPTNAPSNIPFVGTPSSNILQMFPQYRTKFESLLETYPIAYKKVLRIFRHKKVSVIIFTRHRDNGTFPKDIDYTKKDSNPYPKDCCNRVQHLEHEQQLLQQFKLALLNYRLNIYQQDLATFEQHVIGKITNVDRVFPELEQYFIGHTPDNPTTQFTEYQAEYLNFKSQLHLKLVDQMEKFKQWERNCDLKHRRENPHLYTHEASSTAAAAGNSDDVPMEEDNNDADTQPASSLSRNELCNLIKEVVTITLNDHFSSGKSGHNITSPPSSPRPKKQKQKQTKPSTSHQPKKNKQQSNNKSVKHHNKQQNLSFNNRKTNASTSPPQSNPRNKQPSSFRNANKNAPSSYLEALKSNLHKVSNDLSSLQTKLSSYDPNYSRKKTNHQNPPNSSSRSKPRNHFRFESELRGNDRKSSRR